MKNYQSKEKFFSEVEDTILIAIFQFIEKMLLADSNIIKEVSKTEI